MSLKKYILIYNHLDYFFLQHLTGYPDKLFKKLNLSKRQIFYYIKDMEDLGFKIEYSYMLKSYVY
jgi:hypothetical protein